MATNRQSANELVAIALARGSTVKEAALFANVCERTVTRRLESAEFRALVARYKNQILSEAIACLTSGASNASKKLHDLVDSDDEKIALGASKEIISLTLKARQLEGIEREVEEMKRRIDELIKANNEIASRAQESNQ